MNKAEQAEITADECVALLRSQRIGRIVFNEAGAQVRPVNYIVVADQILVRMDRAFEDASRVVFEIDGVDTVGQAGWSVIVEGRAFSTPLEGPVDPDLLEPWAPGTKSWCTTIVIESVAGRWVKGRQGSSSTDDRGYV